MTLALDVRREVRRGDRAHLALRLGPGPLELYLRGRTPTADVAAVDAGGRVAWRLLAGVAVPAIVQRVALGPGESLALEATWPVDVPPGEYVLRASLLLDLGTLDAAAVPVTVR